MQARQSPEAFVCAFALPAPAMFCRGSHSSRCLRGLPRAYRAPRTRPCMQLPPSTQNEPALTPLQRGPAEYSWDPAYPGTLKPGSVDDNYPLRKVLESEVYERMQYEEIDMDERTTETFPPEEDMLQWLAQQGRLLPRGATEEEFDMEADRQISGITEEDLEYADDDSKMIAYYTRQGEGSAAGASTDFGGFAESSGDADAGF